MDLRKLSITNFIEYITYTFFSSITGAMGICFPYLGEFQPSKYRETILCWMELFWTLGVIVLPGEFIKLAGRQPTTRK